MSKRVREPIQVYLTDDERTRLERLAAELGVSRSEILRRGVDALGQPPADRGGGPLTALAKEGLVIPALVDRGVPPAGEPVARLADLLGELERDRADG